ncbi:hypothetical protein [Aquabacterium sp. OR-4]|uniref:hypothetical protein n=1 Tax=Aquabacterium sp. OR-4 TaxID=2978127 RepID=UPI0021B344FB|nr:hypothetical protein [Aquabacterium sp. OR-4]MDT7835017.1 hypothetical protein [Aquabacterium sp. OR-4]
MARRRFRWTRERYRKAHHLSRLFARWVYDLPSEPPQLVQRLWELYERHPQNPDPLLTPLKYRHERDSEIPF